MKPLRRISWGALLLLPTLIACSSDDDPMSSPARVATEVAVDPIVIAQGEYGRALVQMRLLAGEDLSFSFDDGPVLGYRIRLASGQLVSWYPNQGTGESADVFVRQDEVTELSVGFSTTRPAVVTVYYPITWLSDVGPLPAGKYIIEAGLNGKEGECPWGSTSFTISGVAAISP